MRGRKGEAKDAPGLRVAALCQHETLLVADDKGPRSRCETRNFARDPPRKAYLLRDLCVFLAPFVLSPFRADSLARFFSLPLPVCKMRTIFPAGANGLSQIVAIAAGGAVGAVLRYWVSTGIYAWFGRGFPWGTLVVNLLGSFAMGLLFVLFIERMSVGPELRAAVLIGVLGAFTTFSTFSMETLNLIEQAEYLDAGLNVLVSVVACLAACWIGVAIGRQL